MTPGIVTVRIEGADDGPWLVESSRAVVGDGLPPARAVRLVPGDLASAPSAWSFTGAVSHARYTTRVESALLHASSPALGRPQATCAALVLVRKSPAWWGLAQDERRAVLERSGHLTSTLRALPAVARRLHHSRDLGEPVDFLTWFEHAPADTAVLDDVLAELRASEEWDYVDREVELRLSQS